VLLNLFQHDICSYACTAFAFGQTGSGKTHTITGPPEQVHYIHCVDRTYLLGLTT